MTIKIPGSDFIKSHIFEDEPKPEQVPERTAPTPATTFEPAAPTVDGRVYQRLRELTDFASTKAGQAVSKYMPSLLETVGESKAFAAAIKIAHANDGLTDQDIAAAFTEMKANVDSFRREGVRQLGKFKESQIDLPEETWRQNNLKIKQLQIDNNNLNKDLVAAKSGYEERKATLAIAVDRRFSEIQREEQERTNLLNK